MLPKPDVELLLLSALEISLIGLNTSLDAQHS